MSASTAWTYSGDPASSNRDAVRFLVGDTDPADKRLTDGEIAWALTEEANVFLAAALCAESIGGQYANLVSKAVGDLKIEYGDRQKNYADLAARLRRRGTIRGATPFFGGISRSDKRSREQDTDRVEPYFKRGLHSQVEPEKLDDSEKND
jgi:hypothetical protein